MNPPTIQRLLIVIILLITPGLSGAQTGHVLLDFDTLQDFSLDFGSWRTLDLDRDTTYSIQNHSFPHAGTPMSFIVFNPASVSPSMANDTALQPHSGSRFAASFSSVSPPSDDWLISPHVQLSSNGSVSLWVKSYTLDYGPEQYQVAVSTTDSLPGSFTVISGAIPLEAPAEWTKKTFSLAAYANQNVYVAIRCVSNDRFIFMVDDVEISAGNNGLPTYLTQDFENVPDFTLNFDPWTVHDLVGGNTWGINGSTFPNNGAPMAWICFNPQQASPPPANMDPHGGVKFGACFSSQPPNNPNNKWLISPQLHLTGTAKVSLWVRTYNPEYGLEQYRIGVSTAGNDPSQFTIVSGNSPLTAPETWTLKTIDLSAYAGQNAYVGIQCVSNNQFVLMIDDLEIGSSVGVAENESALPWNVYPNPASEMLTLDLSGLAAGNAEICLVNPLGETVRTFTVPLPGPKSTIDISSLPEGIFLLMLKSGDRTDVRKVMIRH